MAESKVTTTPATTTSALAKEQAEELPPPARILVPVEQLKAALSVAAKNDARYYLNGVNIEIRDGALRVVATDGHRLLVCGLARPQQDALPADWPEGGFILSRDLLAEALAVVGKLDAQAIVEWWPGHRTAVIGDPAMRAAFRIDVVDGKFPDWQRVVHTQSGALNREGQEALTTAAINSAYLKSAGAVAATLGAKATHAYVGTVKDAAVFMFECDHPAMLYVMPMDTKQQAETVAKVAPLLGEGLRGSIAALRAWQTRLTSNLNVARSPEQKADLEARIGHVAARIKELQAHLATPQLPHAKPAAQSKPKAAKARKAKADSSAAEALPATAKPATVH